MKNSSTLQDQPTRVLLITSTPGDETEDSDFRIIAPPNNLYLLSSYLKKHGRECEVLDNEVDDFEPFLKRVENGEFDVVGFSVTHFCMINDLTTLWKFREAAGKSGKPVHIIGGGQEAAMNAVQWLEMGLDLIFLGFAQKELLKFIVNFEDSRKDETPAATIDLVKGVQGITYKTKSGLTVRDPSPALTQKEFEQLFFHDIMDGPLPPYETYWNRMRGALAFGGAGVGEFTIENARLYTTSHCPRRCGFCSTQTFLPDSQDSKSPIIVLPARQVLELIKRYVTELGTKAFSFNDDDFLVGNKIGIDRAAALCDGIIEMKKNGEIDPGVRFFCQTRLNNLVIRKPGGERVANFELLKKMKAAGFSSMSMGVETLVPRMLKSPSVNKVGATIDDARTAITAIIECGITAQINIIMGLPEYSPEELGQNLESVLEYLHMGCEIGATRRLFSLPGAPLYEREGYEVSYKTWVHPESDEIFKITHQFIPFDPEFEKIISGIPDVQNAYMDEKFGTENMDGRIVHRRMVGLSSFYAATKLLGRDDLAAQFDQLISKGMGMHQSMAS